MNRLRYKGIWLLKRINQLPCPCLTKHVTELLLISLPTVGTWLGNCYFRDAHVCEKSGARWVWNPDRLKVWLVAIGTLKLPRSLRRVTRQNPESGISSSEYLSKAQARAELNMPSEYRLGASARNQLVQESIPSE